jgi:hypothetical protein
VRVALIFDTEFPDRHRPEAVVPGGLRYRLVEPVGLETPVYA